MTKRTWLALLCLLLGFSHIAAARDRGPLYFGVKGGLMDPDAGVDRDALNMGFDLGYKFNKYLAGEVEYTDTVIEGETKGGTDWDVSTFSVFAALRSTTAVKLKGKIGLTEVDNNNGDDDLELSAGIGVGFWLDRNLMEVEYTKVSDDLDFVSVGVNFFF